MKKKVLKVVAAVIVYEDKILCALKDTHKYGYLSNKYEFPGGKVELNESNEQALIREIKEELNLDITVNNHLITVNHSYPDFEIELISYLCTTLSTDNLIIQEHKEIKWLSSHVILKLDWAAADLPIVHHLSEKEF
ncbi:DNA mismatch repair protein MutT [Acinetobacter sp. TGL-Y2]|uniref:(deoxy)nucleoside triphosphate pyrophosphohydrolase n=1 Tax=Acinetobacter sp. TGL-Y2 TaxID=1407071 RepID=UPI0007A6644F|nr:(deoxy)nucleoside triphosphate pyrophosphohydrolase [Acinetobacter sp. TGL-Y2]AMW78898.1 DNA mismatch repair protein MutT [Acinetobacter sp. TGL-Y2]